LIVKADFELEFSTEVQTLDALREAAYRIMDMASCQIEAMPESYRCRLTPKRETTASEGDIRSRFLDLVTDENLREKISKETERTRDLIMALAFGGLVSDSGAESKDRPK
jgi:His-Xaa-Ser system protein HxsD